MRTSPDLISLTASSAESHTFDLLGAGISMGVLYFLLRGAMAEIRRLVPVASRIRYACVNMVDLEDQVSGGNGDGRVVEGMLVKESLPDILIVQNVTPRTVLGEGSHAEEPCSVNDRAEQQLVTRPMPLRARLSTRSTIQTGLRG